MEPVTVVRIETGDGAIAVEFRPQEDGRDARYAVEVNLDSTGIVLVLDADEALTLAQALTEDLFARGVR